MDEFLGDFPNDGGEHVGRGQVVHGLSEGNEDERDLELVVGEVSMLVQRS